MSTKKITTAEELQTALDIRRKVFIEEQQVPEEEEIDGFDALDAPCDHILVYYQGLTRWRRQITSSGRLRQIGAYLYTGGVPQIYFGKEIILGLEQIAQEKGLTKVKLEAQTHAEGFYEKLGYKSEGEEFLDCNIPHILMKNIGNIK